MSTQEPPAPPPPPPPPPPPSGGVEFQDPFAGGADSGSMDQGKPAVAAAPGRVFIVLGLVLTAFIFIIFNLFIIEDDPEPVVSDIEIPITARDDGPVVGDLPQMAPEPFLELPPAPQEQILVPQVIEPQADGPTNELRQQRIRSSMIISGGGGGGLFGGLGESSSPQSSDPNLQFAERVYASNTEARKAEATHIGDLRAVVAQGRIIQAVLETAINTELPGSIRGIVSRDVYPEGGNDVIIPRGSRLIGQYNNSAFSGQSRVYVVWTRVIRPDGVDVAINSPLIDQIGQAGVAGHVDTRFGEIFSRAILTSAISIAVAAVVDEVNGGDESSTTQNTDGSTTSSGDLTTQASVEAMENFGGMMTGFLRRFIDVQPTILVDQGTPVNVFVNRDLIFPNSALGARFIP